jgi:hypothetical protein
MKVPQRRFSPGSKRRDGKKTTAFIQGPGGKKDSDESIEVKLDEFGNPIVVGSTDKARKGQTGKVPSGGVDSPRVGNWDKKELLDAIN